MSRELKNERLIILISLCFYLSLIEYAIPKPLPFLRLGLANLPIILSLAFLSLGEYFMLVLLKVFVQSVVSGTLFSYVALFSICGSFSSAVMMFLLYRAFYERGLISFLGISAGGAFLNNCAQLLLSHLILFRENTRYIAPLLFVSGLITGIIIGVVAQITERKSVWFRKVSSGELSFSMQDPQSAQAVDRKILNRFSTVCIIISLLLMVACLFVKSTLARWICTALLLVIAAIVRRGKIRLLAPAVVTLTVILLELLNPTGKILFSVHGWKITLGALTKGLNKTASLNAMLFASQAVVGCTGAFLPGKAGYFIRGVMSNVEKLSGMKIRFSKGHVLREIDDRLCEIWGTK